MSDLIEGRHPVLESLKAGRPLNKIMLARNTGRSDIIAQILHLSKQSGVRVEWVEKKELDRLSESGKHQDDRHCADGSGPV